MAVSLRDFCSTDYPASISLKAHQEKLMALVEDFSSLTQHNLAHEKYW
jgi:hypothetical protein